MSRLLLSTTTRLNLFLKAEGQCQLCRSKFTPGRSWDIDHIIPKALGGSNDQSNLQVLCHICHTAKTRSHDVPRIAKSKRQNARHLGARQGVRKVGLIPRAAAEIDTSHARARESIGKMQKICRLFPYPAPRARARGASKKVRIEMQTKTMCLPHKFILQRSEDLRVSWCLTARDSLQIPEASA